MSRKLLIGVPVLFLLSACTGLTERVDGDIDEADAKVSTLVRDIGRTAPGVVMKSAPTVTHEKGIWLGKSIVKLSQPALPSIFYEAATFDRTISSLAELSERITLRSGIPTRVTTDALSAAEATLNNAQGGAASGAGPRMAGTRGPAIAAPSADGGAMVALPGTAGNGGGPTPVRIIYTKGDFKGLLDTAVARFGVSWKYVDGTIHFYHTDSRTFQINTVPGDSTLSATVGSGATSVGGVAGRGAGGVTANNSQNIGVASRLSVYTSIENTVRAMLSAHGRVVSSPPTGSITVVDTPDSLERVAAYIENENKSLSRQIVINVTVLSVNVSNGDEYGINWKMVYNSLNQKFGILSALPVSTDSTVFSAGIIGASRFAGTEAVINALSKQGKVRRQTTASVVTLNNQPVPVQVAKQTSYLASSQTSVVASVGTTTTLTPGTVTSGFNMSILPHVLTNGTVLLQFSTDISSLRRIREVVSGTSKIETPELDTRNFLQRVSMKSNETLIISGFEQTDDNLDRHGVGEPSMHALGGGFKTQSNKESIVILITPTTTGS